MEKGKLIVIDGADGSGKATQAKLLVERLRAEGREVETFDFPQYTENTYGKLLRECLDGKRGDFMALDAKIASTLYAVDRFETKPKIEAALNAGSTVVLDRYVSANMMHQGSKIDDPKEAEAFLLWLEHVEFGIFGLPHPDVIFYLDVPHEVRKDLIENDAARVVGDLAEGDTAHQIASGERARDIVAGNNNWEAIDCTKNGAMRSREDIADELYKHVTRTL